MSADRESRSHQRDEQASDPMADHKRRARWRLLGAVIIVAAVAGIAPLLLEDQARPLSQDLLVEIPSRNSVFSKIESLRPTSPPTEAAAEEKAKAAAEEKVKAAEPKPEPKAEAKSESKPEAKPEQKAKAEPKAEPKKSAVQAGFLVQVGAYSKLEAANTVKARMASGGHRVSVETIKLDDGSERHRVRIGPFETRELANQIRDRAKSQGYDAMVVTP